jgi:threonine dehydrogenase-like Zn-dependent dehydrogenase
VGVPWHLSCGACGRCAAGHPSQCERTPRNAMFGLPLGGAFGGMFSERLRVPYARGSLIKIPDGVDPAAAAAVSDSSPTPTTQ